MIVDCNNMRFQFPTDWSLSENEGTIIINNKKGDVVLYIEKRSISENDISEMNTVGFGSYSRFQIYNYAKANDIILRYKWNESLDKSIANCDRYVFKYNIGYYPNHKYVRLYSITKKDQSAFAYYVGDSESEDTVLSDMVISSIQII